MSIVNDAPVSAGADGLTIATDAPPTVFAGTATDGCTVQLDGKDWAVLQAAAHSPASLVTKVSTYNSPYTGVILNPILGKGSENTDATYILYATVDGGETWQTVTQLHDMDDSHNEVDLQDIDLQKLKQLGDKILIERSITVTKSAYNNQVLLRVTRNGKHEWHWNRIYPYVGGVDNTNKIKLGLGFSVWNAGAGKESIKLSEDCGLHMFANLTDGSIKTIAAQELKVDLAVLKTISARHTQQQL